MNVPRERKSHQDPIERAWRKVAGRQFGVIHRTQALGAGLTDGQIRGLLETGKWRRILPTTFIAWTHQEVWMQRAHAAAAWIGDVGALSHLSAARIQQLLCPRTSQVDVILPRASYKKAPKEWLRIHRVQEWGPGEVQKVNGLWVTTVPRTILDLGAVCDPETVEEVMEDALFKGRVSIDRLQRQLELVGGRGCRGSQTLQRLIAGHAGVGVQSPLELEFLRFCRRYGFPEPARQHPIHDAGGLIGYVDFAYPEHRIAIEIHSYRWHAGRIASDTDTERFNRLVVARWNPLKVTKRALREAEELAERLRKLRGEHRLWE